MEFKFILLVVFANLAQFSVAQTESYYGLSKDQAKTYKELEKYLDRSLAAGIASFDSLFDIIGQELFLTPKNNKALTTQYSKIIAEAEGRANDGIKISLDAIQIALGGSCSAVENARSPIPQQIRELYDICTSALESALSGNFPANGVQVNSKRKRLNELIVNFAQGVYSPFNACLKLDDNLSQLIESGRTATYEGITRTINAFINATEILSNAVSAGTSGSSDIITVEGFRSQFLRGIRSHEEGKFSTIFTVYVFRSLGVSELLPYLGANQLARVVSYHRLTTNADLDYGLLTNLMEGIQQGFEYDDFSFIDEIGEQAFLNRQEGYKVFLDSVRVLKSSTTEAITAAEKKSDTTAKTQIAQLSDSIKNTLSTASSKLTETKKSLENRRNTILTELVKERLSSYFGLLFDAKNDQSSAIKLANGYLSTYVNNFFDATELLADRLAADKVSSEDVAAIETYRIGAVNGLYNFTLLISELGVDVRKAQISSS